jgi:hypothetical protein
MRTGGCRVYSLRAKGPKVSARRTVGAVFGFEAASTRRLLLDDRLAPMQEISGIALPAGCAPVSQVFMIFRSYFKFMRRRS